MAIRKAVRIARIATLGEKRVLLRDNDGQVAAALEVIRSLESADAD